MALNPIEQNPFKNAVEGGRQKREVALAIAEVALPELLKGQTRAAATINDLLTREGLGKVVRLEGVIGMNKADEAMSIRQMAEAIADPSTLYALSLAFDRVKEMMLATGIEDKMPTAFEFLREAGVDVTEFQGVVHKSVRAHIGEMTRRIMGRADEAKHAELLALMSLPYNAVSAEVIKSAMAYGIKATADSRATINLSRQRVHELVRTARQVQSLLDRAAVLRDRYGKAVIPVGEIMNHASSVKFARENGLANPAEVEAMEAALRENMNTIRTGVKSFHTLTERYLGETPSAIEEAGRAVAGSHSIMVATTANSRMMVEKAHSYYSLAAAEALRMLMTHETLTMVMNHMIAKMNREQRDEALRVISQMVQLINEGKYGEAFVLGAQRQLLPEEYGDLRMEAFIDPSK